MSTALHTANAVPVQATAHLLLVERTKQSSEPFVVIKEFDFRANYISSTLDEILKKEHDIAEDYPWAH